MTHSPVSRAAIALCVLALGATPVLAQSATPSGRPDFNGTWDNGGGIDFLRPRNLDGDSICVTGCPPVEEAAASASAPVRAGPNRPVYRPEFQDRVADLTARQVEEDPVLRCLPPGVPRIGPPDKIVQTDAEIVFLYEDVSGPFFRFVRIGGAHRDDIDPSFHGDSIGWWDGEALIVETVNLTDLTWLTDDGAFHTENLRVVEELRLTPDDALEWRATAYDPDVLAEPWAATPRIAPRTDLEIVEAPPCVERSLRHMVDDSYHANPR